MNSETQPSGLPRTLEPEAMDDAIEVEAYQGMDHSAVNAAFVADLITGGAVGPRVVDLGCGTGEIPVLLCQELDQIEVLGVDCSIEMLEAAKLEIELGGMLGRIHLEHADCKTLDGFAADAADTVISNSLVHHVAEPEQLLAQAIKILAPGGRLFVRDLYRPETETEVESLVDQHAGTDSEVGRQLLRQSLHAALTLDEVRDMLQTLEIPAAAVSMTSDRHWTLDWVHPQ